jgi:hypothetical protein
MLKQYLNYKEEIRRLPNSITQTNKRTCEKLKPGPLLLNTLSKSEIKLPHDY